MTTETTENNDSIIATPDASNISQELSDEIDAGIEAIMQESKSDADQDDTDSKQFPPEKDHEGDDAKGGQSPSNGNTDDDSNGGDDPEAITDEMLERAIKSGMTMAEARQYTDAKLLGQMCDRLNKQSGQGDNADNDGAGDSDNSADDLLSTIPDLDPDEYDEKVVEGFKALKKIVGQQAATISELKGANTAGRQSWFDGKAANLGDAFDKEFKQHPEKRDALQDQYEVLKAGYEASGKDIDPDTVFQQAVTITLGDVVVKAANDHTASRLKKRSSQHIGRTSTSNSNPTTDAFEDVAAEIDREFFNTK